MRSKGTEVGWQICWVFGCFAEGLKASLQRFVGRGWSGGLGVLFGVRVAGCFVKGLKASLQRFVGPGWSGGFSRFFEMIVLREGV